jgi:hypothetical protein
MLHDHFIKFFATEQAQNPAAVGGRVSLLLTSQAVKRERSGHWRIQGVICPLNTVAISVA